jgi:hypothetical protein
MAISQNGLNFISQNFGLNDCCVNTGLSWYYTYSGSDYYESGGTAQIISRLASGLITSLTMITPASGTFTQAQLNTANGAPVTLEDAQLIVQHDEPAEQQWCYGSTPPPDLPWTTIIVAGVALSVVGLIAIFWAKKK